MQMVRTGKRKRTAANTFRNRNNQFKRPRRTRRFVPGRNRTSGFYGRFSGAHGELKFHDVDLDDAVIASDPGAITASVNLIPQGVTEKTRVGRKCTLKFINWKFRLDLPIRNAAALPADKEEVRVVLYLDRQANGATAAATDLFETSTVRSFRNLANSGRFAILHDKIYSLNYMNLASDGAGVVSSTSMSINRSVYKTCNIPLEFSSITGAITELRSNNIGVYLVSRAGVCGMTSKFRLRFSDR